MISPRPKQQPQSDAPALPLFAYGSLRDPATLAKAIGRELDGAVIPAVLLNFVEVRIAGWPEPFILERTGQKVEGALISGLSDSDLLQIDQYQRVPTGHYARREVTVQAEPGAVRALTYVMGPRYLAAGIGAI